MHKMTVSSDLRSYAVLYLCFLVCFLCSLFLARVWQLPSDPTN
ncbi:hypothetical protein GGR27_003598 [Lewinella antarctica]|uniref:Uncharacterized protein n=1 Tax=Neolewinella antarctica TaxID=442734 RepID=A0ABX0XGU3_9BACT|nr:hypothetical protein [Neolewinella antarctica]